MSADLQEPLLEVVLHDDDDAGLEGTPGPDLPVIVKRSGYGLDICPEGYHLADYGLGEGPIVLDYFGGVLRVLVYDSTSDEPRYRIVIGKTGEPCVLQEGD